MINLKDGIHQELGYKFKVRLGWFAFLCIGLIFIGGYIGHRYFVKRDLTPTQQLINSVQDEYQVTRFFSGAAWGTYWRDCGAWISADHVDIAVRRETPPFVEGERWASRGMVDAVVFANDWSCGADYEVLHDKFARDEPMRVKMFGFPGGSEHLAVRTGYIYLQRSISGSPGYELPTWIVVFDDGEEPVVGGMSGAIVIDEAGNPVGITVVQNSPTDIDGDGDLDNSADIVSITDVYQEFRNVSN